MWHCLAGEPQPTRAFGPTATRASGSFHTDCPQDYDWAVGNDQVPTRSEQALKPG
jgi:hypothetical protein